MDPSSTAIDQNIQFLRQKLEKHLSCGPDHEKPFARSSVPKHVLKQSRLKILFQSLLGLKQDDARLDGLVNTVWSTDASSSRCKILSTVLLACTRGRLKYLFMDDFERSLNGKTDDHLPFEKETCQFLFGDEDGPKFYETQFIFMAITIEEGKHIIRRSSFRTPYLKETLLKQGSFAHVYKVKIEAGHFVNSEYRTGNEKPVELARKDFDHESFQEFKAEQDILIAIMESTGRHPNIMACLGSLIHGPVGESRATYSLFFTLAEYDLYDFLKLEEHRGTIEKRMANYRRMVGVAEGLEWLNGNRTKMRGYTTEDDQYLSLSYYHCDLKPANILVFQESGGHTEDLVFKISDFGLAIRSKREPSGRRWLGQRSESSITSPRYEGTYLAPEIKPQERKGGKVHHRSDTWPFGCILLLVLIYNEHGWQSVDQFQKDRVVESEDNFFQTGKNGSPVVKEEVIYWLDKLVKTSRDRQEDYDNVVEKAVAVLRDGIFVIDHHNRMSIEKACQAMKTIYNDRKKVSKKSASPGGPYAIRYLKTKESNFLHCVYSAQGEYILFYSPDRMYIYRTKDIPGGGAQPIRLYPMPKQRWSGTIHQSTASYGSSLCASDYLCAVCEQEPNSKVSVEYFECVIYNVSRGMEDEEIQKEKRHIRSDSILSSDVTKVAISPDGEYLALAEKQRSKVKIRLFRVHDLEEIQSPNDTSWLSELILSLDKNYISDPPTDIRLGEILSQVDWVESLTFSGDSRHLVVAIRPEKNANKTITTKLLSWVTSKPRRDPERVSLKDKVGLNPRLSRQPVQLKVLHRKPNRDEKPLTSFVPFHTRNGFVAITYGQLTFNHEFDPKCHYAKDHETSVDSLQLVFVPSGGLSGDDGTAVFLSVKSSKLNAYIASTTDIGQLQKVKWVKTIRFDGKTDAALVRLDEDKRLELLVTRLRDEQSWRIPLVEEG